MMTASAGWYPNPEGADLRYWDGTAWTDRYHSAAEPHPPAAPTPRAVRVTCALLILSVAVAYGIPFFGFVISVVFLGIPAIAIAQRKVLWPTVPPRAVAIAAFLALSGLWLPALLDFFTGIFYYSLGVEVSTGWLILPLCGPENLVTWVLPAVAATVLVNVGVVISAHRHTPWAWVAVMWLAPWAHMAVFYALPHEIIC
jgi:hypothetical protein